MQLHSFVRTLSIIHTVLLVALIAFGIFTYYQNSSFIARMNPQDLFIYIVPVVAAAGYFLSQLLFKKKLATISKEDKLQIKLGKYQTASLIKYALLEGAGFLALMAYYWSGNALHLVIAIALIAYLFVQRPTADKIKKELPLTFDEQKQFNTLE